MTLAEMEQGMQPQTGYHLVKIEKHPYGSSMKILEETTEFLDAHSQGVKIMELVELSDLVGAIRGYLEKEHPGITLDDLTAMSDVTKRAFKAGQRG